MSTHPIPISPDAPPREAAELVERCALLAEHAIRRCSVDWDAQTLRFEPDLSAAEQSALQRLLTVARSSVRLTPAEYDAIAAEALGLRAYVGVASPTNAQSVAAIKAMIRVLRAVLRD